MNSARQNYVILPAKGESMKYRLGKLAIQCLLVIGLLFAAATASAEVYRVGPGEKYSGVSQVADKLKPGDVVEITGDIEDCFVLTRHGTRKKPIVIRGLTRIEDGRIIRPKIRFAPGKFATTDMLKMETPYYKQFEVRGRTFGIVCRGDWYVLEGLDIGWAVPKGGLPDTAVLHASNELVIRNCRLHHNYQAIDYNPFDAGNITLEFSEFDANGYGILYTGASLGSDRPGAVTTVQFCYFHDDTSGFFLKTRSPRVALRYNWFENSYSGAAYITVPAPTLRNEDAFPMHADIVGNVFFQGWSVGNRYLVLKLCGEDVDKPGNEGDYNIAHNLFITTRTGPPKGEAVHFRIHGLMDKLRLFNNVFLEYGTGGAEIYSRGKVWDQYPRSKAFINRRGSSEPVIDGRNNWISNRTSGIPPGLEGTIRGDNPLFADLINLDFRPQKGSPLAKAGILELPKGRVASLMPEFEPQRGIPTDLKPEPRRKVEKPSIGPFEVVEE